MWLHHHFRYTIEEETKFGGLDPDGSWNGMVGHVARQVTVQYGGTDPDGSWNRMVGHVARQVLSVSL